MPANHSITNVLSPNSILPKPVKDTEVSDLNQDLYVSSKLFWTLLLPKHQCYTNTYCSTLLTYCSTLLTQTFSSLFLILSSSLKSVLNRRAKGMLVRCQSAKGKLGLDHMLKYLILLQDVPVELSQIYTFQVSRSRDDVFQDILWEWLTMLSLLWSVNY